MKNKFINLKVYWNKTNGQGRVHLPKKLFAIPPADVTLKIPKDLLKRKSKRNTNNICKEVKALCLI